MVPRNILAFYDSRENPDIRTTQIHRLAEMPLNYLGLVVTYRDIQDALPRLEEMKKFRGVLTWFEADKMPSPGRFIAWAEQVVGHGLRWVILGNLGVNRDGKKQETPMIMVNRYLRMLGLYTDGNWKQFTYDVRLSHKDPRMVEFEHPYSGILAPFQKISRIDKKVSCYLEARWGKKSQSKSDLVVIGPHGALAQSGYFLFESGDSQQWYINPFEFFRLAFETEGLPKPDPATLSGRRIYYSHIDGDGWRNRSEIEKYKRGKSLSSEVILKEAIRPYPDLPVTVAPIAADLDPDWYGTPETLALARQFFALPQVEAGSHTYSHPFFWKYFENYNPKKEWLQFVKREEGQHLAVAKRYASFLKPGKGKKPKSPPSLKSKFDRLPENFEQPRAYADFPFNLDKEISGSVEFINKLLPPGKKVRVLQWSGDTTPFQAAIEKTRKIKIKNINGGDPRLDPEFPSYTWVSPVGAQLPHQLQIYASASNENTYTELWEDRYFGFKHLIKTLVNTESPRRIKPINIYYHMYSGEKMASLNALLGNLNYARSRELAPVTTSHYASIAEGFFSTRFIQEGPRRWRIENRGSLQTLRFDRADSLAVDFEKSRGVIGQRHYQGSLYVSLDEAEVAPVLVLRDHFQGGRFPASPVPYLVQGRWRIWDVKVPDPNQVSFSGQGFGEGEMVWKVPLAGEYQFQLLDDRGEGETLVQTTDTDGLLKVSFSSRALDPVNVTFSRLGDM
ncbi:MAG: hypothetical protein ACE5E9_05580 [Nitrospinaceae bacterium]